MFDGRAINYRGINMKIINCDVCGKRLGTEHNISVAYFSTDPTYHDFMVSNIGPTNMDICLDCEDALRKAVHETIEKLKSEAKKDVKN